MFGRRKYKPTYLRRRRRIFPVGAGWPDILAIIRNKLLAGVAVAIPLIVTLWVVGLIYSFVGEFGSRLIKYFTPDHWILTEPWIGFFGFLITLGLLFFLGVMATNVLGRRIIEITEALVLRIPVVASIYSGVKQVMDSFKGFNTGMNFKRVVYVDYPAEGCRLIGFMTGQFHDAHDDCDKINVFLPTSPNPMTGFVLVIDSDKVIYSDLTLEEASKMIFTAGLVPPKRSAVAAVDETFSEPS